MIGERSDTSPTAEGPVACSECEALVSDALTTIDSEPVCRSCAEQYYVTCGGCSGLVAEDETVPLSGAPSCKSCSERVPLIPGNSETTDLADLVDEYVRLQAEGKRIEERLGQIKEILKATAETRERVSNAVTLTGSDGQVRCSYSTRLKCDTEKVSALESHLDPNRFADLFERKVTFSPVKKNLERVISGEDASDGELGDAIRDAVEVVETPMLTVPKTK